MQPEPCKVKVVIAEGGLEGEWRVKDIPGGGGAGGGGGGGGA